jgi:hypothetical protein
MEEFAYKELIDEIKRLNKHIKVLEDALNDIVQDQDMFCDGAALEVKG